MNKRIVYRPVMDSTNVQAHLLAEDNAEHGTVVTCDVQTGGKGRMNRTWESPKGGLWFSLLLRPKTDIKNASMITLVMALAVSKAVRELGVPAGIKWPNDIVIGGRKVCGILTEMFAGTDYYVIVGTGVNVNIEGFSEDLKDKATSILLETGKKNDRAKLLDRILDFFEEYYNEFIKDGNLSSLVDIYNEMLVHKDKEVFVLDGEDKKRYFVKGIDETGALLAEHEGKLEKIVSGEIHVRGIYGYV